MLKKIMAALVIPILGVALVAAATTTSSATSKPGEEKCCCIVNDAGQLVCTITGRVLDECCCK